MLPRIIQLMDYWRVRNEQQKGKRQKAVKVNKSLRYKFVGFQDMRTVFKASETFHFKIIMLTPVHLHFCFC